jgi:hypothetical protein
MAISGTITLSTASTNMSTFDLYACTSSSNASCSVTAFETNVTRSQLLNGFVSNSIPDGTTYIKINPNSAGCLNQYIIVELSGAPTCSFDATIVYGLPSVTLTPTPTPTGTPTPTPTPTIPTDNGQCYTYTLDYGVSTSFYGVSYVMPGVGIQILQFNSLPSNVGPGDSQIYFICSEVEPTLLDTYNWPSTTGIGGANGISRTGPNGYCSNNFDCYTN